MNDYIILIDETLQSYYRLPFTACFTGYENPQIVRFTRYIGAWLQWCARDKYRRPGPNPKWNTLGVQANALGRNVRGTKIYCNKPAGPPISVCMPHPCTHFLFQVHDYQVKERVVIYCCFFFLFRVVTAILIIQVPEFISRLYIVIFGGSDIGLPEAINITETVHVVMVQHAFCSVPIPAYNVQSIVVLDLHSLNNNNNNNIAIMMMTMMIR